MSRISRVIRVIVHFDGQTVVDAAPFVVVVVTNSNSFTLPSFDVAGKRLLYEVDNF
jgi:hypothetical protein